MAAPPVTGPSGAPVADLAAELPEDLPLVLASWRGPLLFGRDEQGQRTVGRGPGGLVSALRGVMAVHRDTTWVCATASDEDVAVAREAGGDPVEAEGARVRFVHVEDRAAELAYGVIANPLLWFVQHGLWGHALQPVIAPEHHVAWDEGYRVANEELARAVVDEVKRAGRRALVMLQDYHLYLAPRLVREAVPDVLLTHFVHIPWPGPDAWRVLPPAWREELLQGLLGADVVAFHTERSQRDFLLCCQELLDLPVDLEHGTVAVAGRVVRARHYPISVDVPAMEELGRSEEVRYWADRLGREHLDGDRRLLLRVDRTDPSKNIVRGFAAYQLLLEEHPEWRERVTFLALLQPSRQDVDEYSDYVREIGAAAAEVNARYGRRGWQPVDLRFVQHLPVAVGAYSVCDVLVVNALADGMNLVAKEALLVNRRGMVLALSENTGAHTELGAFAVTLAPYDVAQQAQALHEALSMPEAERFERAEAAAAVVRRNDVTAWLTAQLADLDLGDLGGGDPRHHDQPEQPGGAR